MTSSHLLLVTPVPFGASDMVELVQGLAWPLLIAVVIWRLYPSIRRVIDSRGFTVKVGGAEITVQQVSDQAVTQFDDLRQQVSALKAQLASSGALDGHAVPAGGDGGPVEAGVPRLRRVLWVDDHPENNAFEMAALRRQRVEVVTAVSSAEGSALAESSGPWDAVVSDVGRVEDGEFRPDAGLELAAALHERDPELPVVLYTTAPTLARVRDRLATGVAGTASGTELLDLLGRIGGGRSGATSPRH